MDSIQLPPSIDDSKTEEVNRKGFVPEVQGFVPEVQGPEPGHDPRSFVPPIQEPDFYYEPQRFMYPVNKPDPFSNMDKTMYIIMFIAFILGFFMGKTMQPVILRHG